MVQDAEMDSVRARFPPIHLVRLGQEMMTLRIGLVGFSTQEEIMVGGSNDKYKVLVDGMGIMLPPSEIDDLQASLIACRQKTRVSIGCPPGIRTPIC